MKQILFILACYAIAGTLDYQDAEITSAHVQTVTVVAAR